MTERFGQCFVMGSEAKVDGPWTRRTLESSSAPDGEGAATAPSAARSSRAPAGCSCAQGFDAASMGEIAREAGVSKGTLYVYFDSKEELFEAIVEEQCRQQGEQIFTFDASDATSRAC